MHNKKIILRIKITQQHFFFTLQSTLYSWYGFYTCVNVLWEILKNHFCFKLGITSSNNLYMKMSIERPDQATSDKLLIQATNYKIQANLFVKFSSYQAASYKLQDTSDKLQIFQTDRFSGLTFPTRTRCRLFCFVFFFNNFLESLSVKKLLGKMSLVAWEFYK